VLGSLGVKKGVCQGMSAIVAAFQERARYEPGAPRLKTSQVQQQVRKLLHDYRRGCPLEKMSFAGFSSLRELCATQKNFFLKQSVWNNADIALHEIANRLPDFLSHKKNPIHRVRDQQDLAEAILGFRRWLSVGRKPLLLVHSHVTTILSIDDSIDATGNPIVVFWIYDSNPNGLGRYEVRPQCGWTAVAGTA
jgi:hypothetical protein